MFRDVQGVPIPRQQAGTILRRPDGIFNEGREGITTQICMQTGHADSAFFKAPIGTASHFFCFSSATAVEGGGAAMLH